jgi:homoserine O-acetyltransferase/O-succinyltransferase
MHNNGNRFVKRFDSNAYLRIMEAWQRFDLAQQNGCDSVVEVLKRCRHQKFMVFSIDSDVCFYPDEQSDMVQQLKEADVPCRYLTVHSDKGHDSFLLEPELFTPYLAYMLEHDWEFGK